MTKRIVGSSSAAAMLAVAAVAAGQIPSQPTPRPAVQSGVESPADNPSRQSGERAANDRQITLVGCVAREDAQGGAAATRSGGGDEFVLVNATAAGAGASGSLGGSSTGSVAGSGGSGSSGGAVGTSGSTGGARASGGASYSLTGDREGDLSKYVGQRVEIVATMATMDRGAANAPEGSARPSDRSADAGDAKEPMPRATIVSFKPVAGACQ